MRGRQQGAYDPETTHRAEFIWLKINVTVAAQPTLMDTGRDWNKYKEKHDSEDSKEIHLSSHPFWDACCL